MVSEPSPHASTTSTMISITTEGGPRPARDWDAMNQDEKARIERKLDEILEMMRSRNASPSTTPAAPTSAAAPALGVGSPSSGPGSSATSGASPVIPDARLVLTMDTTSLGAPLPTRCSTESPSCDAIESRPAFDSATAPSATLGFISVFVATAASDGALGREAISATAIQATGLKVDTHKLFEERPPQIKFEGEAWSQRLKLKPPWPSVTLISRGSGISCHIWERFKKCNPTGHIETTFPAPELHMPRLVANFCTSPTCSIANDPCSTSRTWYYDDEPSSVKQWCSNIKEVQQVIVGSWSCVPGFPIQIYEDVNRLKCPRDGILYVTNGSALAWYICTTQIVCTFSLQQVHGRVKLLAQSVGHPLCKWNSIGYQGPSVNCCLRWASEQEKLLFYSAYGHVHLRLLQSETAEIHQLITQPGKNLLLFLLLKLPWLSILTHVYRVVEEREVYPNREVITLNSKIIFAALGPYVQQLIDDCLLTTLYQEEQYSSCSMLLSEAKALEETCGILIDNRSRLVFGILGVQVTWSAYYSVSDCTCEAHWKQGCGEFSQSNHGENLALEPLSKLELDGAAFILIFLQGQGLATYQRNTRALAPKMQTCFEAWFSYVPPMYTARRMEKPKGNGELTCLISNSNLLGERLSSNSCDSDVWSINSPQAANAIFFLVLVDLNGEANQHWRNLWDPSGCMLACYGKAHSKGGRNVTNQAAFSDQVHVIHDYYIAFVDKIPIGYDFYLDQTYYFDPVYDGLKYYSEDCLGNPSKLNEVHTPWDPGKLALCYPSKASAWGQAEFQGGRNVRTLDPLPLLGLVSWASNDGPGPSGDLQERLATNIREEAAMNSSRRITMN